MPKATRQKTRMKGSLMGIVLLICLICAIVGTGLLALAFHSRMLGIRAGDEITARLAADAALADAVFHMNQKLKVKPWDNSILPAASNVTLAGCNASFDYTVSEASGNYRIQATGRSINAVHSVDGFLRIQSVFDYALFARDAIELKNSANVNWINKQPDDWPLQVGTNSTNNGAITLKSNTTIEGDVIVGVGGDPYNVINGIYDSSVNITGQVYSMFSNAVLPSVSVPASLAFLPSGGDIKTSVTLSASGRYNTIDLKKATLTITEPVMLYITGTITLDNDGEIVIGGPTDTDNDASLIIYLYDSFIGGNGVGINNLTQDATKFTLFGLDSCTDIRLKNGGILYGTVYAPNASIILDNSADVYGSIVGQSFILKNSATFYYDAALRDRTVHDEAVRFVVHRWAEH